ncbi:glycosyltransferase [Cystobacter fuscus]|uniref:glycosyltransferase n=1 Tax=Cystobacter fuscus TaxID=43 RepID=UPI002B27FA94|nr:glycosyltransferase family 1 protein [Cystobacter fuscus]
MASTNDVSRRPATFLLASSGAPGHLLRVLDLAQQLTARGNRVLFKAKASLAADVKAVGAEHLPHERMLDVQDIGDLAQLTSLPPWMPSVPFGITMFRGIGQANNVQLARELEPVLKREKVDCVVHDFFELGAAWAAERAGIPWASAGNMGTVLTADELPLIFSTMPSMKPFFRFPALTHLLMGQLMPLNEARAQLGLSPYRGRSAHLVQAAASPKLHIIMGHRGLAGSIPLRDNQLFVGPTTANSSTSRKEAPRIEPGTVVVSTTTTHADNGLFRRVLEAVAPMNVPVLATAAGASDVPSGLGSHIRIERYVPHDEVFPKARALITHGGWGAVGRALYTGLPMLVIPLVGDQTLNASLVERAGLGRYLPLEKATPERIRSELQALLADESLRARARKVSSEIQQLKSGQVAARALEKLAFEGNVDVESISAAA